MVLESPLLGRWLSQQMLDLADCRELAQDVGICDVKIWMVRVPKRLRRCRSLYPVGLGFLLPGMGPGR